MPATDRSKPSRARSIVGATSVGDPPAPSTPTTPNDKNDRSYRLSLRKARKLSRVFTDFSLLDTLTPRKSVEDLRAQRQTSQRPSTSHGYPPKTSFEGRGVQSLDGKIPHSIAASSTTTFTIPRTSAERISQSPRLPNTPTTPHSASTSRPEDIPLPPSRPGSSRGGTMLIKRHRKSLDLRPLDEFGFNVPLLPSRSKSARIPSTSELSRPTYPSKISAPGTESSPDIRDPPQAAHHHYVEVKRARKMTQLFGQELPPELIRVLNDHRNPERTRPRVDSTTSSLLDSDPTPTTLALENEIDPVEDENVAPLSSTLETPRVEFQERRRRVAKLSQFFGVNHAEIPSSLVFKQPKSSGSRPPSLDDKTHRRPMSVSYAEPVEVGVKVVSRRRWGLGEDMRDVELSDAINQLRSLKSS